MADVGQTTTPDSAEAEQLSRLKRYDNRVEEWLASLEGRGRPALAGGTWCASGKGEGRRGVLGQDGRAGTVEESDRRWGTDSAVGNHVSER